MRLESHSQFFRITIIWTVQSGFVNPNRVLDGLAFVIFILLILNVNLVRDEIAFIAL